MRTKLAAQIQKEEVRYMKAEALLGHAPSGLMFAWTHYTKNLNWTTCQPNLNNKTLIPYLKLGKKGCNEINYCS